MLLIVSLPVPSFFGPRTAIIPACGRTAMPTLSPSWLNRPRRYERGLCLIRATLTSASMTGLALPHQFSLPKCDNTFHHCLDHSASPAPALSWRFRSLCPYPPRRASQCSTGSGSAQFAGSSQETLIGNTPLWATSFSQNMYAFASPVHVPPPPARLY